GVAPPSGRSPRRNPAPARAGAEARRAEEHFSDKGHLPGVRAARTLPVGLVAVQARTTTTEKAS
ncbi:hypothetical protein G6539_20430, partial [Streptomyces albidoflavus]|nr:hypothetical protein [Streptomyces albidoflavus]